jgi:hypothetical protein
MFKDTTKFSMTKIKPMKEDPLVNMVIAITIINKVLKDVAFKHKKPFKSKSIIEWKEEEKLRKSFEVVIHNM